MPKCAHCKIVLARKCGGVQAHEGVVLVLPRGSSSSIRSREVIATRAAATAAPVEVVRVR